MQNKNTEQQIFILDGQLIGCIFYIISILLSIIIILDQRQKTIGKKGFLTSKEVQNLALINKIAILLLIVFFLYLNYEALDLTKKSNQSTKNIELQIIASYLSIIVGAIGLYVVANNINSENITLAETENPYI